jgi:hypothetical protein
MSGKEQSITIQELHTKLPWPESIVGNLPLYEDMWGSDLRGIMSNFLYARLLALQASVEED